MSLLQRTAAAALVAGGFALGAFSAATSAQAAPAAASAISSGALLPNSDVVQVREFRRHGGNWGGGRNHHHRGYYNDGWYPGAYLGLGVAGAIIGGALSEDYDEGPAYESSYRSYGGGSNAAMERCAAQFRSFEWDTGLYTTYDGERRLCPYLG